MPSSSLSRILPEAPNDYGLIITFDSESSTCLIQFVPDQHLETIHPNAYGPADLNDLEVLGGGGSGVRVFRGHHPQFGPIVMKHGGYKDTKELFALATIAEELRRRNPKARADMKWRIPEYRMLYISPCHLRDTPHELWSLLSKARGFISHSEKSDHSNRSNHTMSDASCHTLDSHDMEGYGTERRNGRDIHLYTSSSDSDVHVTINSVRLKIALGSDDMVEQDDVSLSFQYGDYHTMKTFLDKLLALQKKRMWKFTQAQKSIGKTSAKTGMKYLSTGTLRGDILETLIHEYVHVIRNLQQLTLPGEEGGVDNVREEVKIVQNDCYMRPFDISDEADAFVGFAIKKNYHPDTGRFFKLRRFGKDFRAKSITLTSEEKTPGRLLGIILKPGAKMSDAFKDSPDGVPTALDTKGFKLDTWRVLLRDAVNLQSSGAVKRVWSGGIADGGLHNLFLCSNKMWLFDLGEPCLQPLPAFLTKFLFSFFHGLGMVDDSKAAGCWVNRFVPGKKLALTEETKILTAKAYAAFKVTVDRLLELLFDGEEAVRGLLVNYVTLQLLSDAGFCLERWVIKGGGKTRQDNHHKHLEQWLWRALWDVYIASDLNTSRRLRYVGAKVNADHKALHGPAM